MITDSFLNSCFSLLLSKNTKVQNVTILYRDILEILDFYEKKETLNTPLNIQTKLNCLKTICGMFNNKKSIDNVFDSISFSGNFEQYQEFLTEKLNSALTDVEISDTIKQIRLRKKINSLFKNYDELSTVLETIKDGSFDSIDDLIEDYEVTIKKLYANMTESNRISLIESASSLDLLKDDYAGVVDMIVKKYEKKNTTSTGFQIFDDKILMGGFEPSRLYVFGGGSGAGKSTLLNNFIIKSASSPKLKIDEQDEISNSGEIEKVYVYITLENTIEEALLRTYMPIFDRTIQQTLQEISSGVDIKKKLIDELKRNNSTIVMKYFPAMSISYIDLMGVLDEVIETYGKEKIAGLYVDYLDLLKTDSKYDLYRIELGHITLSLKTLAVQYNIPVITATQLGRSVYKVQSSHELNVDQMGESIKKVEHADFVALLASDPVDETIVYCKIGKNRSGKSKINLDMKVDFSRFNFININVVSNKQKSDVTSDVNPLAFSGLNMSL
jgi:replicative DNA helicase